jgi:hypothetical protein
MLSEGKTMSFETMADEILFLRTEGRTIAEISALTGWSLTEVCNVIYERNRQDKEADGNFNGVF